MTRVSAAAPQFQALADTSKAIDGRTFYDLGSPDVRIRLGGRVLFEGRAHLNGEREDALYLFDNESTSLVLSDETGVESAPDDLVHLMFWNQWQVDSNDAVAGIPQAGYYYRDVLLHGLPGALAPLLQYGKVDPGNPDARLSTLTMVPSHVSHRALVVAAYLENLPVTDKTPTNFDDARSWILLDGGLEPFMNLGDAAPADAKGKFISLPAVHSIDAEGRILFQAQTSSGIDGFFTGTARGNIEFVDRIDTLREPFGLVVTARFSRKGMLTVVSDDVAPLADDFEKTVWYGEPGDLKLLARSAVAPDVVDRDSASTQPLWRLDVVDVSQSGEWMVIAGQPNIETSKGLWVGHPEELHELFHEGEYVPGFPDVYCVDTKEAYINDRGQMVAVVDTSGGDAIFRYDPRLGLELLAQEYTPITIDGEVRTGLYIGSGGDVLAEDGTVYLVAGDRDGRVVVRSEPLPGVDGDPSGTGGATDLGPDEQAGAGSPNASEESGAAGAGGQSAVPNEGGPSRANDSDSGCSLSEEAAPKSSCLALPLAFALLLSRKWLRRGLQSKDSR